MSRELEELFDEQYLQDENYFKDSKKGRDLRERAMCHAVTPHQIANMHRLYKMGSPHPSSRSQAIAEFGPAASSGLFYHGTSRSAAESIETEGFRASESGMLGAGVYVSSSYRKALHYAGSGGVVLMVMVNIKKRGSRNIFIEYQGHLLQNSWQQHGYDLAYVPSGCGMVPSGLEEACFANPAHVFPVGRIESDSHERPNLQKLIDTNPRFVKWVQGALYPKTPSFFGSLFSSEKSEGYCVPQDYPCSQCTTSGRRF